MIQEAVNTTLPLVNRCGVVIEDTTNHSLEIDRHRIIQVGHNLIKNAIDFVPLEEGIKIITQEIKDYDLILSICDNGQAILEDKIKTLFRKFYQIENSATEGRDSTGLGLCICKTILQHGGKIWAESILGKGATMRFSLLLKVCNNSIVMTECVYDH